MANQSHDPLDDLIADGKLRVEPLVYYSSATILTVDLEVLHNAITSKMSASYLGDDRFANRYGNSDATLKAHISTMADYAVGQAYNRLRGILEMTAYNEVANRMKNRCPIFNDMEFPAWISSLIGSIGSIRVSDGPVDVLYVYATSAATMNNYGRANVVTFNNYAQYDRLLGVMKGIGIILAPVDHNSQTGSAFPTIAVELRQNIFTLYGTLHHSHYDCEDVVRAMFCTNKDGVTPFEQIGMTIGYVDDQATINALKLTDAPRGIPEGQTVNSAGRPVAGHFNVNYFGICPTVPAAGIYVIGHGVQRCWQCILAERISVIDSNMIFSFRLRATSTGALFRLLTQIITKVM